MDRLSQILNARWLIAHEVVYNYFPVFLSFLNGQKIDFSALDGKSEPKPYLCSIKGSGINTADKWDLQDYSAPANSVAVIPIQSEIMSWKTMELVQYIALAEANPNVIAVVFLVNSPGGMVFYTDIAAAAIKGMQKPSVAFVMNMAASAAMWLISGTGRIVASSPLDRFGSIGVMASIMDWAKFFKEKLNVDVFEIYADKSTNKNISVRKLLDENLTMEERTAPIREDLNYVNGFFHKAIQDNLGIEPESDVFTGQIYNATSAIDMGLAHEINSFEYAVQLAHNMGLEYSIKSQFTHLKL